MFKRTLAALLALTLCLAIFAGCGEKTPAAPANPSETPAETPSGTPTDSDLAVQEGALVWNIGADPKTWDPGLNSATDGSHIINNLFEGLIADEGDGKLVPAQAESYEVSEDGLTYTFKLREGLKWSDGQPLTAKDYEYSWKRVCDPATAAEFSNFMTQYIVGANEYLTGEGDRDGMAVKALDDLTLEVKLKVACPYFLSLCSFYTYYPVRQDSVESGDGWERKADKCISNGPFMLESYKTAERIEMVKNPNYRDAANVKLERITGLMIVEATTAFNGYVGGKIQILESSGIPTNEVPNLEATDPNYFTAPQSGTWYLIFNVDEAPFNNVNVRKAFSLAIDNKKICEILKGGRLPSTGFISPVLAFSDGTSVRKMDAEGNLLPEFGIDPNAANPEEAKKALADAGYPNGEGLPAVSYSYNTNDGNKIMAEALQEMWRTNLGIEVELKNQEWAVFQNSRKTGDFQMARGAWVSDYADPMSLIELFTVANGNNDAQWRYAANDAVYPNDKTLNPEQKDFEDAVNKMIETKGTERDEWIRKAEQVLHENWVVYPVYYYVFEQIIDEAAVEGVRRSTMGQWIFKDAVLVA